MTDHAPMLKGGIDYNLVIWCTCGPGGSLNLIKDYRRDEWPLASQVAADVAAHLRGEDIE